MRKIIHIDADCFFAAVEMRDNPSLVDKPIAVGGSSQGRGVISTCNYPARRFGIHSAMPTRTALRLCPQLVLLPHRFDAYRDASHAMRRIFYEYTDLVEPLSLDEAFLDVTGNTAHQGSATRIAHEIRQRIEKEIGITVSAGIAPNKFLAKIASDWHKPNGQKVITPDAVDAFVTELPVGKIFGVGKAMAAKLAEANLLTCGDLQAVSHLELVKKFGTMGQRLYSLCRGIDDRPVVSDRRRKSLSVENTFSTDLPSLEACLNELPQLTAELMERLQRVDAYYRVVKVFVKIKFSDFTTTTIERAGQQPDVVEYRRLCEEAYDRHASAVRLLGVGVRFVDLKNSHELQQLDLFSELTTPSNETIP